MKKCGGDFGISNSYTYMFIGTVFKSCWEKENRERPNVLYRSFDNHFLNHKILEM